MAFAFYLYNTFYFFQNPHHNYLSDVRNLVVDKDNIFRKNGSLRECKKTDVELIDHKSMMYKLLNASCWVNV